MSVRGCVDAIDRRSVTGWAYDDAARQSARVVFLVDGRAVGETVGTTFRPDLLAAGIGDGCHGFVFELPPDLEFAGLTVVTARSAEDGSLLHRGDRLLLGGELAAGELFQGALSRGMWRLESLDASGTEVTGWGVPPFGMPIPFTVLRNGAAPASIERFARPDIAVGLGLPTRDAQFGFRCRFDGERTGYDLAFADARTRAAFSANHSFVALPDRAPVPDEESRLRIGSGANVELFRIVGSTVFSRIDQVLRAYFHTSASGVEAVLDWGCGCGRVLRYFPRWAALTGIDIDAENVAWSRANFPGASFHVIGPRPPTPLPNAAFDLVFGISVMTHLNETNHHEWLRELQRLTKPGGGVLLSIHGEYGWLDTHRALDEYAAWRARGFSVLGKNADLDEAETDASLYYNTFITRRYVYEVWSAYFDVLDVIPGAVINQDFVVLRRRADDELA